MSSTGIVVTILVIVALAFIAFLAWQTMRRKRLQQRFGPEYERAVADQPSRAAAEQELRGREQRHAELELRALPAEDQQRYAERWKQVQGRFVDDPQDSVHAADELITAVMRDRRYPIGDFDEQIEVLSVEHAQTLDHYRSAHAISLANERGEASTEQLRQAVVHYRMLAGDLLGPTADGGRHTVDLNSDEREPR